MCADLARRKRLRRRPAGGAVGKVIDSIPHDFALATQTVFYAFAAVMAVAFVVALVAMPSGKVEEQVEESAAPTAGAA